MSARILRRYTNLPNLIYMLSEQKLTLVDPENWHDKNDSRFLSLYRKKKKLKTVLALCFTQVSETYHHWKVFADGSSGVCIQFDEAALLEELEKSNLIHGEVQYLKLNEIRNKKLKTNELPFLKRYAYQDEREFRIIYESKAQIKAKDIPIHLDCIDRITLSPQLPNRLKVHVQKTIKSIHGCSKLDVFRSTLISNDEWMTLGENAI
jgi:hypothetical protein